jgi:tetratricopeptide (TPR) repeat protein
MRFHIVTAIGLALAICAPRARAGDSDVNFEIAKKHYELGAKLYEASNIAEALVEFNKAYALRPLPALLFNIARCHEVMANLKLAVEHYRRFLREKPDAPERAVVEARITNLEKRLREESKQVDQKKPPSSARPAPVSPPPHVLTWRSTVGWIAIGLGSASLVTGIACGVLARGKSGEYDDGVKTGRPFAELDEIDSAGKGYNAATIATLVVGGVLAAGGVGLVIWDRARPVGEPERPVAALGPRLLPFVGGDGAGLLLRGSF